MHLALAAAIVPCQPQPPGHTDNTARTAAATRAHPQAAALDYVKAPSSQYAMVEKKAGGKDKGGEHKLTKKLKGMAKGKVARAAVVSVEGRNVTVRH